MKVGLLEILEDSTGNITDEMNRGSLLKLYNRRVLRSDVKRKCVF